MQWFVYLFRNRYIKTAHKVSWACLEKANIVIFYPFYKINLKTKWSTGHFLNLCLDAAEGSRIQCSITQRCMVVKLSTQYGWRHSKIKQKQQQTKTRYKTIIRPSFTLLPEMQTFGAAFNMLLSCMKWMSIYSAVRHMYCCTCIYLMF